MFTWILFISLVGLFYTLLALVRERRNAVVKRVYSLSTRPRQGGDARRWSANSVRQGVQAAGGWLGSRLLASRVRGDVLSTLQGRLTAAGNPLSLRPIEWLGLRLLATGAGALLGLALGLAASGVRELLVVATLGLLGWRLPELWLSRRISMRQESIRHQLPSALDLLTISVEAGLGFDQALSRVAQRMEGPMAEEFRRTLREIQLGSTRSEAMQRLGSRTGVDALRTFTTAIVQADRLGTGLAPTLRIQSASLREKRRIEAQERALKAPVKMMVPLVLFVFPSVFIVVLGPAVIHVIRLFTHGGV